ncbi:arylsulfatase B-like [Amphiura filiformis]|uniref:arylsulfatase B-like n=1 Tax=Amphiura filiformis TaxID=82378 RepID=UPI003B22869A
MLLWTDGSKSDRSFEANHINENTHAGKPHIVFILVDDLGYNDVGYNGQHHGSAMKTPSIDKLAAEGVILSNYYVQATCTPTRSQLLTGRYQVHTGMQHGTIHPCIPECLPLDEVTLAEKMQETGYSTHMIGKWHLGHYKKECLPTKRGFDTYLGYYLGNEDYYTHYRGHSFGNYSFKGYAFHDDTSSSFRPAYEYTGQYATFVFTQEVQKIVKNYKSPKPLFIYLPFHAVHNPLQVPKQYSEPFKKLIPDEDRVTLAGMISCLDEAVQNITTTLKETGLYNNTIIIFSTDNGGPFAVAVSNWPLRGSKATLWEGGVRGVGFIHSPLLPKEVQGTTSNAFIHVSDWFPTIVSSIAGGTLNGTKPLDGYDVWEAITTSKPSKRNELLHNIDPLYPVPKNGSDPFSSFNTSLHAALRIGDWKILTGVQGKLNDKGRDTHNSYPPPESNYTAFKAVEPESKHIWLFNITADPNEWNDLADDNPTVVEQMLHRLQEYYLNMTPPIWHDGEDSNCDPAKHEGVWGPWE